MSNEFGEFPYGKPSAAYFCAVGWLLTNKKWLLNAETYFDYPDYWGMPTYFSHQLSSDEVDYIQAVTEEWNK